MGLDLADNFLANLTRLFGLVSVDLRVGDERLELLLDLIVMFEFLSFLGLGEIDYLFFELLTCLRLEILDLVQTCKSRLALWAFA